MKRDLIRAAVAWFGALVMMVVIAAQMTRDNHDMARYFRAKTARTTRVRVRRNDLVYQ
jgi:predicted PurR-regulated permease PerM